MKETKEKVTYTLGCLRGEGDPPSEKGPYIATLRGKQFLVGNFDTRKEATAAADGFMSGWLDQLAKLKTYRFEKIGTVTVDVGTIIILDPCRINSFAATQPEDDMCSSPLMPEGSSFKMDGSDGMAGKMIGEGGLAKQLIDPPRPSKVANPTRLEDFGHSGGNAVSLSTGLGDGEYEVMAEIVDYGPHMGERIAAIHIQFVADEDLLPYRQADRQAAVKSVRKSSKAKGASTAA